MLNILKCKVKCIYHMFTDQVKIFVLKSFSDSHVLKHVLSHPSWYFCESPSIHKHDAMEWSFLYWQVDYILRYNLTFDLSLVEKPEVQQKKNSLIEQYLPHHILCIAYSSLSPPYIQIINSQNITMVHWHATILAFDAMLKIDERTVVNNNTIEYVICIYVYCGNTINPYKYSTYRLWNEDHRCFVLSVEMSLTLEYVTKTASLIGCFVGVGN